MYRGAKLKNTKWIYGLVVYTGRNTKIMLNLNKSKNKMSQVERKLNNLLIYIFILQNILCLIPTLLYSEFRYLHQSALYYVDWPT